MSIFKVAKSFEIFLKKASLTNENVNEALSKAIKELQSGPNKNLFQYVKNGTVAGIKSNDFAEGESFGTKIGLILDVDPKIANKYHQMIEQLLYPKLKEILGNSALQFHFTENPV